MGRHTNGHGVAHKRRRWIIAAAILLVFVAAGAGGLILYAQITKVNEHEQHALQLLGGVAGADDLDSLRSMSGVLAEAQHETSQARNIAHGGLWNIAAKIPFIGNDIATVQGMTIAFDSMTSESLPKVVEVANSVEGASLSAGDGHLNLQPLITAQGGMQSAYESSRRQSDAYDALPGGNIGRVKEAYASGKTQIHALTDRLGALSDALQILPDVLGSRGARTYAVMAQTTSEARSSGGLIGSVGTMTTNNGAVAVGDFRANSDYIPYGAGDPTSDEVRLFQTQGPLQMSFDIRDLAAYPDTARTAEGMKAIWQRTPWGANATLDGVLLVDPVFLQELVKANGDVTLSDGRVLTGSNTAEFLLNTVYKEYPVAEQDAYFSEVVSRAMGGMFQHLDFKKLLSLTTMVGKMSQGRHFSMYAFDKDVQSGIADAGLTAQTPSDERHPSIGVYVNEQNASKLGWYIHRTAKVTRTACNANGSQSYHVEYTMTNSISQQEVASLPAYIVGVKQAGQPQGYGIEKTLLYAPAGGSITSLSIDGEATKPQQETMNGSDLYLSVATVAPGKAVSFSFDVTTSSKAESDLTVDQTPQGSDSNGVTVDATVCATGR